MWQIIGAGAIGCLWSANLIRTGEQVKLISRRETSAQQLFYQNLGGDKFTYQCSISDQLSRPSLCDNSPILVCVKAPQVKQALTQYQNNISDSQVIILMHNGMGCAEQVAELFPNNPIICATTANASLLNSPFNITQTGLGISFLGPFNEQAKPYFHLAETLNNALDNTIWCEDIEQKLWLKLIINIAINPLTAIYQINNGSLAQKEFQEKINTILEEALPVLEALQLPFNKCELLQTINTVISATADNFSSMNRDIFFKRTTENEFITGFLTKKASQFNIETPFITSLYQQIKVLESHSPTLLNIV